MNQPRDPTPVIPVPQGPRWFPDPWLPWWPGRRPNPHLPAPHQQPGLPFPQPPGGGEWDDGLERV